MATQKAFLPTHWRVLLAGVAALAVFSVALVLYRSSSAKGARQPPIKSLAVLPLTNLSGDPKQEYLADGMTEALIGRLSEIHNLRVISRTSVMRFKDTHLSVPEIARTLQFDAIVEGSVIRDGSRIRGIEGPLSGKGHLLIQKRVPGVWSASRKLSRKRSGKGRMVREIGGAAQKHDIF